MSTDMDTLMKELKFIRRELHKVFKLLDDPDGEKAKLRSEHNGFKKPLNVTQELRSILNLEPDQKISRSEVTTKINEYAKINNLKNGQEILMNDTLKALLTPPEGTKVTFMNLQTFLNRHYVKDEPVEPESHPTETAKPKRPRVVKKA
jgi:chromatin remodeling complex protein RSC6